MLKRFFGITIATLGLLNACGSQDKDLEQEGILEVGDYKGEMLDSSSIESLPYVMRNQEGNGLVLIDLLTNEIIAESNDFDHIMVRVDSFSNGDIWAFGLGIEGWREDGFNWNYNVGSSASLFIFDNELNLKQEYEITDEGLINEQVITMLNQVAISYQNNELMIYYSDITLQEKEVLDSIYTYNVITNERTRVMDISYNLWPRHLQMISETEIAFVGNKLEDEIHTYFGVIDLETEAIQYAKTELLIREMFVNGSYLLLTESPFISFDRKDFWDSEIQGEIVVFDLVTGEDSVIQLEEDESLNAKIVEDQYVLTATMNRIRLYDLYTNEIILERELELNMVTIEDEIDKEGNIIEGVYPQLETFLVIHEGLYAVVFNDGRGTFHVELVEVGV